LTYYFFRARIFEFANDIFKRRIKMKRVISIILVVVLTLATMGLVVGCGQSDYQRAERILNDAFDSLGEFLDELEDIDIDEVGIEELFDRLLAFEDEMTEKFESFEAEMDELDLTDDEEDRLDALVDRRIDEMEARLEALFS